ncbi:unnamed protein product [Toxocara canis]|uniref:DUF1084 domain-containing protein n=1 Tax=Toxocara canis TaxID=6265 RepID=A0A183UCQ0_TOXCA|nr:unnamed protein product [Toxocara canis]
MNEAQPEEVISKIEIAATAAGKLLVCGSGVALIAFIFRRELYSKHYHSNAKCLLLLHYATVALSASGMFISTSVQAYTSLTTSDRAIVFWVFAKTWFYAYVYGNCVSMSAMFSLGIERAWSTFNAHNYENTKRKHGIFLFIISILAGAICIGLLLFCSRAVYFDIAAKIMYSFAVIEVLSIAIFTLLYVYNVKWRRSQIRVFATLSHKYQVDENVTAISRLLPVAVVQTICNLFNCIVTPILVFQTRKTRSADYINIMPLYYVLLPLLTLWIDRKMQQSRVKGKRERENEVVR